MSQNLRVLLVEDSEDDALLLLRELGKSSYDISIERVETADEMKSALEKDCWDIVLADYALPQFNGLAALETLNKADKDVPFILVSGAIGEETAVAVMKAGAHDYVMKNNLARLVPAIEREIREAGIRRERVQAEVDLRDNEEKFRQVFNNANDAIYLWELREDGMAGRCVEVNDTACRMLGYSRDELFTMTPKDIDSEDTVKEIPSVMEELLEKGHTTFEMVHVSKDGRKIPVEISSHVFTLHDKSYILSITRDIAERKCMEEQLRQSQKMEAIGRLAGGIAHDFNNMMTAIIGYSEMLKMDKSLTRDSKQKIEEILKSAERIANLTQQILAFSRKQTLQPRIISINRLISETEEMLCRLIGEDIELETRLEPELWRVKADQSQIEQVIMNLSVNARDAMPDGGKLIIETKNVHIDVNNLEEPEGADIGDYVLLSESDTGYGLDEEAKEHIFEPFFTTKEVGKGTGLGLSTVYGIVKQSGGYITVDSEVDKGTIFNIYLPRVKRKDEDYTEEVVLTESERGTETILVVEDEDVVKKMTCDALRYFSYTVIEAGNGREAIEAIEEHGSENIDLLITDVIMPEMSGKELTERLFNKGTELKVLYISGYTDDVVVHHSPLEEGASFLQKPFSPRTLAHKVREILKT